jgi:hypothetical protein
VPSLTVTLRISRVGTVRTERVAATLQAQLHAALYEDRVGHAHDVAGRARQLRRRAGLHHQSQLPSPVAAVNS